MFFRKSKDRETELARRNKIRWIRRQEKAGDITPDEADEWVEHVKTIDHFHYCYPADKR
jgi:hypothetical protein